MPLTASHILAVWIPGGGNIFFDISAEFGESDRGMPNGQHQLWLR